MASRPEVVLSMDLALWWSMVWSLSTPAIRASEECLETYCSRWLREVETPLLGQGGVDAHQENDPLPLKARPGWFVQQPIIGGLNQPPRLRPIRRLRGNFLMGAATPPLPRRGV